MSLTKDDVQAMRQATTVCVRFAGGPTAEVQLIKRRPRVGPFDAEDDVRRVVTVPAHDTHAWFHINIHNREGAWAVLASIVRPGDALTLEACENGNDYLRYAECPAGKLDSGPYDGLFADELRVSVRRQGKPIVGRMVVAYSVCPDNSARAIRGRS